MTLLPSKEQRVTIALVTTATLAAKDLLSNLQSTRGGLKRAQATGGLLGGLQKLVARHKPEDNLFEKLTKLLKLASEDKLHPGASAGKPKGKQHTREKKSDRVDQPAADTQDKKLSCADKAKGKKPDFFLILRSSSLPSTGLGNSRQSVTWPTKSMSRMLEKTSPLGSFLRCPLLPHCN